jgi:homoserine dehydrogenase
MVHDAKVGDMKQALDALRSLACVRGEPTWMRVETLQ